MEHLDTWRITQAKLDAIDTFFKLGANRKLLYSANHPSVMNGIRQENEPYQTININVQSAIISVNDYSLYRQLKRFTDNPTKQNRLFISRTPAYKIDTKRNVQCGSMTSFIEKLEDKASLLAMKIDNDNKPILEDALTLRDTHYIYRHELVLSPEPILEHKAEVKADKPALISLKHLGIDVKPKTRQAAWAPLKPQIAFWIEEGATLGQINKALDMICKPEDNRPGSKTLEKFITETRRKLKSKK